MASAAPAEPASGGWSIRILTILGIPVRVHVTFLALLVWFAWTSTERGDDVALSVIFLLLLFGCVLLHELGHALMARVFGVTTRDIVLYPIGGIARLENIPSGRAELFIALAGPAVNVLLALALFVTLLAAPLLGFMEPEITGQLSSASGIVVRLLIANLALCMFNLIPAFPMDGGRVLRAALSLATSESLATRIATRVGQVLAALFAVGGIAIANPFLVLIALFVFVGASQEAFVHRQRAAISGKTARHAMVTRFAILSPQASLTEAARLLVDRRQQHFPVVDAWDRTAGMLSRARLMTALGEGRGQTAVLEIMDRDVVAVAADADLSAVLDLLLQPPRQPVLVVEAGRLVGLITIEDVAEFIEVHRNARDGEEPERKTS